MNHHGEAVLANTHNLCLQQKYEKYQIFLSENFQFLEMKFSIYLNRCVFVMLSFVISFFKKKKKKKKKKIDRLFDDCCFIICIFSSTASYYVCSGSENNILI